jgi:hypothetical protein
MNWAGRSFGPALKTIKLVGTLLLCSAAALAAQAGNDTRRPVLPETCEHLEVDSDHKVVFHVYAVGVQIYSWSGTEWVFVAPAATLYANEDFDGEVGTHFAGPTWQSNSGSKVVEKKVEECTPDPTAISWLLLETVTAEGPGIFSRVTFVQRVNTVGGLAPSTPGESIGQEVEVPYTAEYVFYRRAN